MQSSTLTRITVGTLGVLLTGTTAFAVHQVDQANAWQKEAAGWQATAQQTNQATSQLTVLNQKLVRKYNRLAKAVSAQPAAPLTVSASAPVQTAAPVQAAPAAAPTAKAS